MENNSYNNNENHNFEAQQMQRDEDARQIAAYWNWVASIPHHRTTAQQLTASQFCSTRQPPMRPYHHSFPPTEPYAVRFRPLGRPAPRIPLLRLIFRELDRPLLPVLGPNFIEDNDAYPERGNKLLPHLRDISPFASQYGGQELRQDSGPDGFVLPQGESILLTNNSVLPGPNPPQGPYQFGEVPGLRPLANLVNENPRQAQPLMDQRGAGQALMGFGGGSAQALDRAIIPQVVAACSVTGDVETGHILHPRPRRPINHGYLKYATIIIETRIVAIDRLNAGLPPGIEDNGERELSSCQASQAQIGAHPALQDFPPGAFQTHTARKSSNSEATSPMPWAAQSPASDQAELNSPGGVRFQHPFSGSPHQQNTHFRNVRLPNLNAAQQHDFAQAQAQGNPYGVKCLPPSKKTRSFAVEDQTIADTTRRKAHRREPTLRSIRKDRGGNPRRKSEDYLKGIRHIEPIREEDEYNGVNIYKRRKVDDMRRRFSDEEEVRKFYTRIKEARNDACDSELSDTSDLQESEFDLDA